MGVSSIYFVEGSESVSSAGGVDSFQNRLDALGGKKIGVFRVECTLYQRGQRAMYLLKLSDRPNKRYSLIGDQLLEADEELESILDKLKGDWKSRTSVRIEGIRYELGGDFVVRIGTITAGATAKGIAIDVCANAMDAVEYAPCDSLAQCEGLMQELMSYIVPNDGTGAREDWVRRALSAPPYDYGAVHLSSDLFTPRHAAFQYVQLLRSRRLI